MKRKMKRSATSSDCESLPKVPAYEPKDFLCCHGNLEKKVKVWACAFEPSISVPGETHNIVATCGGDTVCLVDVTTGKTMKRYKDTDRGESFYTLAWTTLENEGRKMNILAVAGEGSAVKLIYPDQLVLYSVVQGHKKRINCLAFHPTQPQLLFSGSQDGHIKLWDIGPPDLKGSSNHLPLMRIRIPQSVGDPLSMVVSVQTSTLVVAAEYGCVGWSLPKRSDLSASSASSSSRMIEKPSLTFKLPKSGSVMDTIDSLIALDHGLVASKRVGSGEIVIWDVDQHIKSRGSKRDVTVSPLVRLKFPDTSVKYLNMGYSTGLLGVGDDAGKIHLYDVTSVIKSSAPRHLTWLQSSCIVDWPEVDYKKDEAVGEEVPKTDTEVVINMVAISSDHRYLTGATDNNLVCVWQQES